MNNKKGVEVSKNTFLRQLKTEVSSLNYKLLFAILTIGMISFVSCEKEAVEEPGNIPGMGYTDGSLEAQSYDFNDNLSFGEIRGVSSTSLSSVLKSTGTFDFKVFGSGDQIRVEITVTNDHSTECRSLWFRAGTVFEVDDPNVQHAILMCPVNVCVPPNSEKTFILDLYCLNEGKDRPTENNTYTFLGVTTSKPVLDLLTLLQGKKINWEHYVAYPEPDLNYADIIERLQEILWKITNGSGLTSEDTEFINGLPNLPIGVLPEGVYDIYIPLPLCWCYDECNGNTTGALSFISFAFNCDGEAMVDLENGLYTTDGFNFNVETNYKQTSGTIKFEEAGKPQLGENGSVDIGYFTFELSCLDYDAQFDITTKNQDEITQTVTIASLGEGILMTNGFMVELVTILEVDNGYEYTFRVISDSCEASDIK
ncbi:hypothetical protein [Carboxylicivirga linearis]|uniref:Uncharacterized protein n=1 Tax=Carboxylicivirga linearis TaxID=1628157 RepID=A0ABS5JRT4_9BACT|nr:hypothetical protein [Carboxylicivirga linearis]MBS2097589.1 hypothetical protein [Carboxylicivirga linearis]